MHRLPAIVSSTQWTPVHIIQWTPISTMTTYCSTVSELGFIAQINFSIEKNPGTLKNFPSTYFYFSCNCCCCCCKAFYIVSTVFKIQKTIYKIEPFWKASIMVDLTMHLDFRTPYFPKHITCMAIKYQLGFVILFKRNFVVFFSADYFFALSLGPCDAWFWDPCGSTCYVYAICSQVVTCDQDIGKFSWL